MSSSHWLTVLSQRVRIDFAGLHVPGIRQNQPVAHLPSRDRLGQGQCRVAGARLRREAHEGRRPHAAVHRHFPEHGDSGAELLRIGNTAAKRVVGDGDHGRDTGCDRCGDGAHFQDARDAHPHVARHHLQVRDVEGGIDGGVERKLAVDRHRVGGRGRIVDGDGVSLEDPDHVVVGRDFPALPRGGTRPAAALNGLHAGAREIL